MKKIIFFNFSKINFSKEFFIKNKSDVFVFSLIFMLILGFFIGQFFVIRNYKNQYVSAQTEVSPDAIAIRVIPNPNNYSASRWYKEQKFSGSPQSLLVDGYGAVRDGRTVYVNAANIDIDTNTLYTNIYLISYNQEAENATVDIFGRVIGKWKFNTNLPDTGAGDCSISNISEEVKQCNTDTDCGGQGFCDSLKARITRDVLRLADFADFKTYLVAYYNAHNNKYPTLTAGTYIANHTISVWPSWNDNLAKELGAPIPKDPINKLGPCSGYDPITCWDEKNKKFADPSDDGIRFNLPDNSYGYVYKSMKIGDEYDLCANMETGMKFEIITDSNCIGNKGANRAPEITKVSLPRGTVGAVYKGYAEAVDADGDLLAWTITCSGGWSGWDPPCPKIQNAQIANQKMLYANRAGAEGVYNLSLFVNDGREGAFTKDYSITIANVSSCVDADTDGYNICDLVDRDDDGLPADCDDGDGRRNPGKIENCSDGIDNDCDEKRDCEDSDCALNSSCPAVCNDNKCEVGRGECSSCEADCSLSLCCGDKKVDTLVGEQCDDGNKVENDQCDNDCQETKCGDGIIQNNPRNSDLITEQCDDGNTFSGDGCDKNCQNESFFCVPDGCNGFCSPGCLATEDPDCGCYEGNNCCGVFCTIDDDSDCGPTCGDGYCNPATETAENCSADCQLPACIFPIVLPCIFTSCAPVPTSLVGWWPGDDNANDYEDGNNGNFVGSYADGKVGKAFNFNGSSDYVRIPETAGGNNLDGFSALTINAWINAGTQTWVEPSPCPAGPATGHIVSKYNSSPGGGVSYLLAVNNSAGGNKLRFKAGDSDIVSQDIIPTGWINVTGVWAGSNNIKLYINGNQIAGAVSGSTVTLPDNSVPVNIGRVESFYGCYNGPGAYFVGQIDEAQIYNKALTQEEIQIIANAGSYGQCKPLDPRCDIVNLGLVSWWPGEDNANDLEGINNGSAQGGSGYGNGIAGKAFSLNGSSQYISIPNSNSFPFGIGDFTISVWVNFNSLANEQVIIERYIEDMVPPPADRQGWSLTKLSDNKIRFAGAVDSSVIIDVAPGIAAGQWAHVAVTRDNGLITAYWNNAIIGTVSFSGTVDANSTLKFGHRGNSTDTPGPPASNDNRGFYLNGLIDEVQIYNRGLSKAEIGSLYSLGGKIADCR